MFEFILIQPGTFMMGSPEAEEGRYSNETQHKVTLTKPFYIQTTPVTQAQWQAVMGNNPSDFKGEQRPVERVSWHDAQEFIAKLNARGEGVYRLPTEAEWEYCCRAGSQTPFGVGNGVDLDSTQANFDGNYPYGQGKEGVDRQETTPVKSFEPNNWGLYDMHGNVWEWCQDWYGYLKRSETDPQGPQIGSSRIVRGGSWSAHGLSTRSALRINYSPDALYYALGFRLAKEYSQTLSEIDLLKEEIKQLKERLSAVEVKL